MTDFTDLETLHWLSVICDFASAFGCGALCLFAMVFCRL
jgi:hypothetical protein